MTTTYTAAVQLSTSTVYGIGTTRDAALADARGWLDTDESLDGIDVVPCTERAAEYVREHGGQPSDRLTVSTQRVCLREEE